MHESCWFLGSGPCKVLKVASLAVRRTSCMTAFYTWLACRIFENSTGLGLRVHVMSFGIKHAINPGQLGSK